MKTVKASVVLLLGMLLVTTFACGGSAGQGTNPTPTPVWATYTNVSNGFSIQYPQDWTKLERINDVIFIKEVQSAPAVVFISVYEEEQGTTVDDDYVDQCILAMRLYSPGDNISESSETTVAGMPAHKFICINTSAQTPMKRMEIHTIKDNMLYITTYMTSESVYPAYLTTVQQMIDSLVIY